MAYVTTRDTFNFQTKRTQSGRDLAIMNSALRCTGSECDIYESCPYSDGYDYCKIHKDYITNIIKMVYKYEAEGKVNDHQLHTIGVTMMPLYTHLFRFQIAEAALSTPVVYGKTLYMHPVYKEIRNTTKLLFDMWAKMGLMGEPPMPEKGTGGSVYDLISAGDDMVEAAVEKQTKNSVDISAMVDDIDEGQAEQDSIEEEELSDFEAAEQIVNRKKRGRPRKLDPTTVATMTTAEMLAKRNEIVVEGDDGDEIIMPEGFDPDNLPEASEMDAESFKQGR